MTPVFKTGAEPLWPAAPQKTHDSGQESKIVSKVAYERYLGAIRKKYGERLDRKRVALALSISRTGLRAIIHRHELVFKDGVVSASGLAKYLACRKQVRAKTILGLFGADLTLENMPRTRTQAIAFGAFTYFTGKPCRNGHTAARLTSSACCVQCIMDVQQGGANE